MPLDWSTFISSSAGGSNSGSDSFPEGIRWLSSWKTWTTTPPAATAATASTTTATTATTNSMSSWTQLVIPYIIMGLSMGVGYCGLEFLLSWFYLNNAEITPKTKSKTRLHEQLIRHMQQMKTILSWSDAKTWFVQYWTVPLRQYTIWGGLFVTVLPAPTPSTSATTPSTTTTSTSTTTTKSIMLNKDKDAMINIDTTENDAFLTLPPQLHVHPRLAPLSKPKNQERYLEMLLHNISHTDLVLGLNVLSEQSATTTTTTSLESMCLCRPRFSAFDMYCRKLLRALSPQQDDSSQKNSNAADIILVPQYQRSQNDPRYTIQPSDRPHVATGFSWNNNTTHPNNDNSNTNTKSNQDNNNNSNPRVIPLVEALADLRVRGKDMAKLDPYLHNDNHNTTTKNQPLPQEQDDSTPSPSSPRSSFLEQVDDENAPASPTTASWNVIRASAKLLPTSLGESTTTTTTTTPQMANKATVTSIPLNKQDILVELKAIFFPLLATLLPRWHAQIAQKYSRHHNHQQGHEIHKILVLVTGVGTPRNWTHSITGNSTQALADLMELFLQKVYPDITVVKIHSDTNIFRYDDNILFVQQELMPTVNAYRDAHATQAPYPHEMMSKSSNNDSSFYSQTTTTRQLQPAAPHHRDDGNASSFDVDWKKSFAVTLSFADGSPARTHAIQTALRIYRPAYFHIWQLKTFWHERKIVDDDVEVHSFEEMETSPALESSELQGELAQVVQEMKNFRQEMTETLLGKNKNDNDIHSFWLRKTHKPVLAVLLVQSSTDGGPPILYRGTNMEVSMPTGSLCAERNVIGTALASNPKLKRQDLKCIAVLAVPQPKPQPTRPPRSGSYGSASDIHNSSTNNVNHACGSCRSSRQNSVEESTAFTMTGRQMRRESFDEREEDWMLHVETEQSAEKARAAKTGIVVVEESVCIEEERTSQGPIRQISLFSSESSNSLVDMIKHHPVGPGSQPGTPHKYSTSNNTHVGGSVKEKRTVIVRSNNHDVDLNPLRPCGACHEWLKKIAECNPYFQIMTFTDADCNGVYLTPCQE